MKELIQKLEKQEQQLNEIYATVKQLKKYFLTTIIISAVTFLLPIIGIAISIPWFLKTLNNAYQGLL